MSTRNLCFRAKIRKNVYPCTPQSHYIKEGCKGVFVTWTCFRDETYVYFQQSKNDEKYRFSYLPTLLISACQWLYGYFYALRLLL